MFPENLTRRSEQIGTDIHWWKPIKTCLYLSSQQNIETYRDEPRWWAFFSIASSSSSFFSGVLVLLQIRFPQAAPSNGWYSSKISCAVLPAFTPVLMMGVSLLSYLYAAWCTSGLPKRVFSHHLGFVKMAGSGTHDTKKVGILPSSDMSTPLEVHT